MAALLHPNEIVFRISSSCGGGGGAEGERRKGEGRDRREGNKGTSLQNTMREGGRDVPFVVVAVLT